MADWTGNMNSIFKSLGASNHTEEVREENDYYATDPFAIDVLCAQERFYGPIWEPACGGGHMSKRLIEHGYDVVSTDLFDRGYGKSGVNFLEVNFSDGVQNIITNPPYKYGLQFVKKALELVPDKGKVAMFLKLTFLEGKKRKEFFLENPPKTLYVSSSRLLCAKNAEFQRMIDGGGSAVAYGWYVWVKGEYTPTVIRWVN